MFRTATHGNGIVTTFNADPNKMARPSSITATFSTTTYWNSGTYQFDGSGNIKAIGADDYVYDSLSRLTYGEVGNNRQEYIYDPYGNITGMKTFVNGAINTDHTMSISTATNRLLNSGGNIVGTYDTAGNQITRNGNYIYGYDALNMVRSFGGPGRDEIYIYTADDERIWEVSVPYSRSEYSIRDLDRKVLRVIVEDSFATPVWSWKEDRAAEFWRRERPTLRHASTQRTSR